MAEYTKDEPFEFEGLLVWRDRRAIKWRLRGSRNGHDSQVSSVTADTLHAFIEAERDEWRWENDEHTEARRGRWVARVSKDRSWWYVNHADFGSSMCTQVDDDRTHCCAYQQAARTSLSDFLAWKSAQEQPEEPTEYGYVGYIEDGAQRWSIAKRSHDLYDLTYSMNGAVRQSLVWDEVLKIGPVTILSPGVDA